MALPYSAVARGKGTPDSTQRTRAARAGNEIGSDQERTLGSSMARHLDEHCGIKFRQSGSRHVEENSGGRNYELIVSGLYSNASTVDLFANRVVLYVSGQYTFLVLGLVGLALLIFPLKPTGEQEA